MFPCLIAPGVELRLIEERHAAALFAAADRNRQRLREWLPWVDPTRSSEQTLEFIRASLEQFERNEGFSAGIWVNGGLGGCIGTHKIDWANRNVSIGYWIDAAVEGRGIVTRATQAVLRHLFETLELERVEIRCGTGNARSGAIPERLGFTREGVIRHAQWVNDRYLDLVVWGMLRAEWRDSSRQTGTQRA